MPSIDFRQLRATVKIAAVLELLGFVVVVRTGDQIRGDCPLHVSTNAGKSRSFSAHLSRNTFPCIKCGASDNQLDLWAKATKLTVYEAAMNLCARLNKKPPSRATRTEKRNP